MREKQAVQKQSAETTVRGIRRAARRQYSAEERIRIVLEGLRGEESIAALWRKEGGDTALLQARQRVYAEAKARHPGRWSGPTRDWTPVGEVWLNPQSSPPTADDALLKAA